MAETSRNLPPVIRAWIEQLLDPDITRIFEVFPDAQVDIKLGASRGKVRLRPVVILNGGSSEMVDPTDLT